MSRGYRIYLNRQWEWLHLRIRHPISAGHGRSKPIPPADDGFYESRLLRVVPLLPQRFAPVALAARTIGFSGWQRCTRGLVHDDTYKPVTLPGKGLDEFGLGRPIVEHLTNLANAVVQALLNLHMNAIAPDVVCQRLTRDDLRGSIN